MNILALSDTESPALWDYFDKSRLEGIDVIVSCGDLKAEYLSFLATFFYGPVLYVHGNHDEGYLKKPPEGCVCIDDQIFTRVSASLVSAVPCAINRAPSNIRTAR